MEKITKEQVAQLPKKYRGNLTPAYINTLNLQVDERLHLTPQDWGRKYPISNMVRRISKKYNRQFTLTHLAEANGWIIERLK